MPVKPRNEAEQSQRFITPVPLPTPFEDELCKVLIEEFLEAGIRASKLQRFGIMETQPGQSYTNGQRLGHELGDVLQVIALLLDHGIVEHAAIKFGMANKAEQLTKFLQHIPPGGDLFGERETRWRDGEKVEL